MPWENKGGGGGPWGGGGGSGGSGGGGPWGRGGGGGQGGGPRPPDFEDFIKKGQDRFRTILPGGAGGLGKSAWLLIVVLVLGAWLLTGLYRVQTNEQGVVLRFGQWVETTQPGLNWHLPWPIETALTPSVTTVQQIDIGFVAAGNDRARAARRDVEQESLMLTGDENIVDIDFSVFWVINNAADYLFNMEDPDGTVKSVAESAMREVVGRSVVEALLTQARQITETDVQALIQQTLDEFGAGILITQVQLLKVDPPADVIAAFRDVQAARADAERVQNEAQTYANKVVPEARGQASQIENAASAYRDQIIAEATGKAQRFDQVYESYKAAPDVTRRRMYLETMEQVFGGMDKVIIDESGQSNGVVPYLPLDALSRSSTTGTGGSQ